MKRTIVTLALLAFGATNLASQELLAIKAGKVITISEGELQDVLILVENGKIKAIGKDLETPWDAKVIDASDKVIMPTYVLAHTSGGMSQGNENMANVPFLTVQDAVDPASSFFAEALRNGIGTIHVIPGNNTLLGGCGMVVRPHGKTVEDMAVLTRSGLKMSLDPGKGSRMAKIQQMRRALTNVRDAMAELERKKQEFAKEKAAGATEAEEFEEKLDEKQQPIADLLTGKERAFFYIPSTAELAQAHKLLLEFKLNVVLVLGHRCHKASALLAKSKLPIILDPRMEYEEKDPQTDKDIQYCPAATLHGAGAQFAIITASSGMEHYPWWQMATAIRNGMPRDAALRAMTLVPAKILGLDDQFGSIEVGKVANLQILTGDPLQATTWVSEVLLEGKSVYQRSKDQQLQHLFGEIESKPQDQEGNDK